MAANVENMVSVRQVPWHGLGTIVQEAMTSEEALRLGGLDWTVDPRPLFTEAASGEKVEVANYYANVRSSDNSTLGVVTGYYKIVQNQEAFAFTDALIGEGCRFETAGSLAKGKKVWMMARLPEMFKLNGDDTETFLLFSNSHDGSAAVRVAITPVRVVCQNTLNIALAGSKRMWSTRHVGAMDAKLEQARETLQMARDYMAELQAKADVLAQMRIAPDIWNDLVAELIPVPESKAKEKAEEASKLVMDRVNERRNLLRGMMMEDDLNKFRWTAWGAINAVADFADHVQPLRQTLTFDERRFENVIAGTMLDKTLEILGV